MLRQIDFHSCWHEIVFGAYVQEFMVASKKQKSGFDNGSIFIKRARENNLKNLTVELPRGKLIGVTGVSGSGKSSLVFDVMAAEGQENVESLSTQARQALESQKTGC